MAMNGHTKAETLFYMVHAISNAQYVMKGKQEINSSQNYFFYYVCFNVIFQDDSELAVNIFIKELMQNTCKEGRRILEFQQKMNNSFLSIFLK